MQQWVVLYLLVACSVEPVTPRDTASETPDVRLPGPPGCVPRPRWQDLDRDGYGDPATRVEACPQVQGLVDNDLDCDDGDPLISPDGLEECDGIDNDCDGAIDGPESYGAVLAWPDEDQDGYGLGDEPEVLCELPEGWVTVGGDCDDTNGDVNPEAPEVLDGVDEDCDGVADDGLSFGDGADGALVVSGDEDLGEHGFVCTPVTALEELAVGVEDASAFANGDRALLIDLQGEGADFSYVGEHEWIDILGAGGGRVELLEPLEALAEVDPESQKLALFRVPAFETVQVDGRLSAPAWDGACGGLLVLVASSSIEVSGSLEMAGAGFGGGAQNLEAETTGEAGDSWSGVGTKTNAANGGGGGGGGKSTHACEDCESHGGGGGYGADGGDGERGDPTHGDGGQGGVEYGSSSMERLFLGSGGGAGACDTVAEGGLGGAGGDGGGAIWLRAPEVEVTGVLDVSGEDGQIACAVEDDWCGTGAESEAGSGGGGSGGSVRVQGVVLAVSSPVLQGGVGAAATDGTAGWAGDGAVGRSRVETLD